jgi:hypothetical protein
VSREACRWAVASLPLAPTSAVVYLFFEWLFVVTKPSPTAGLPLGEQLLVLLRSPRPLLLPLLGVQALVSLIALVGYPRARAVAVLPAALVGGTLLLVLADNFTYTVFGFGILTAAEPLRIVYAALWPTMIALAGWKLLGWLGRAFLVRGAAASAIGVALVLASPPLTAAITAPPQQPGLSLPPATGASGLPAARPNILFLGIDGLDATLLSVYGYERPTTPFLESLKEESLVFENAFSNATRTHGSLVTLLTGRLPFQTKVTFPPTVLQGEDARRNLPMLLKGLGYSTLQIGMRHYADAEDVNLIGFDAANYRWQNLQEIRPRQAATPVDGATDVFRGAVAERLDQRLGRLFGMPPVADAFAAVEGRRVVPQWRDERRVDTLERYVYEAAEPWFVHLHMLDTHCCEYFPAVQHFSGGDPQVDARDSQILESDRHMRRLFEALERSGRLDRTIVVISSDHGSQWKSTVRIPLIMRFPNKTPRGQVQPNVQIADIAPTMLAYLGSSVPQWMDGVSLLDPAQVPRDRRIFGVSEILRREGPAGLRLLLDSGPPNYGAAGAMMVEGDQWFDLRLATGALTSGRVPGHTRPGSSTLGEHAARAAIAAVLGQAGFRTAGGPGEAALTGRP